jgi:hypothetical protein
MQPMRTPLKTELGLAAAEANRGSVRPVAAANAEPRKLRRVSGFDFMGRLRLRRAASSARIPGKSRTRSRGERQSAADKVLHLTDHHEAEEIIQEKMKVLLKTIQKCEFFEQRR